MNKPLKHKRDPFKSPANLLVCRGCSFENDIEVPVLLTDQKCTKCGKPLNKVGPSHDRK